MLGGVAARATVTVEGTSGSAVNWQPLGGGRSFAHQNDRLDETSRRNGVLCLGTKKLRSWVASPILSRVAQVPPTLAPEALCDINRRPRRRPGGTTNPRPPPSSFRLPFFVLHATCCIPRWPSAAALVQQNAALATGDFKSAFTLQSSTGLSCSQGPSWDSKRLSWCLSF